MRKRKNRRYFITAVVLALAFIAYAAFTAYIRIPALMRAADMEVRRGALHLPILEERRDDSQEYQIIVTRKYKVDNLLYPTKLIRAKTTFELTDGYYELIPPLLSHMHMTHACDIEGIAENLSFRYTAADRRWQISVTRGELTQIYDVTIPPGDHSELLVGTILDYGIFDSGAGRIEVVGELGGEMHGTIQGVFSIDGASYYQNDAAFTIKDGACHIPGGRIVHNADSYSGWIDVGEFIAADGGYTIRTLHVVANFNDIRLEMTDDGEHTYPNDISPVPNELTEFKAQGWFGELYAPKVTMGEKIFVETVTGRHRGMTFTAENADIVIDAPGYISLSGTALSAATADFKLEAADGFELKIYREPTPHGDVALTAGSIRFTDLTGGKSLHAANAAMAYATETHTIVFTLPDTYKFSHAIPAIGELRLDTRSGEWSGGESKNAAFMGGRADVESFTLNKAGEMTAQFLNMSAARTLRVGGTDLELTSTLGKGSIRIAADGSVSRSFDDGRGEIKGVARYEGARIANGTVTVEKVSFIDSDLSLTDLKAEGTEQAFAGSATIEGIGAVKLSGALSPTVDVRVALPENKVDISRNGRRFVGVLHGALVIAEEDISGDVSFRGDIHGNGTARDAIINAALNVSIANGIQVNSERVNISAAEMSVFGAPLTEVEISAGVLAGMGQLRELSFKLWGGNGALMAGSGDGTLAVMLMNISATELMRHLGFADALVPDVFNGTLRIQPRRGIVGTLATMPHGAALASFPTLPDFTANALVRELTQTVLLAINYNFLRLDFDNGKVKFTADGRPADPIPFVADPATGEFRRAADLEERFAQELSVEIDFNLN